MKLVVAGGTGFLGRPLSEIWAEEEHEVIVLTRSLAPGASAHEAGTGVPGVTRLGWVPDGRLGPWASAVEDADAVVNLAGESIAARRWSAAHKQAVRESRVLATRSLAAAILGAARPPRAFISSSGVNYYGHTGGSEEKTEDAPPGTDYLAEVCTAWEEEARRAARPETRVAIVRTGMVLELDGGALPEMARPFRYCLGGPLASGRQYVSWVHKLDWIELVRWLVITDSASGPFNAVAPVPVTNRELSRTLARAMHRPALFRAPAFALRLAFGEMADTLLIGGQRAVPTRALSMDFYFRYPEVDRALRAIYEA